MLRYVVKTLFILHRRMIPISSTQWGTRIRKKGTDMISNLYLVSASMGIGLEKWEEVYNLWPVMGIFFKVQVLRKNETLHGCFSFLHTQIFSLESVEFMHLAQGLWACFWPHYLFLKATAILLSTPPTSFSRSGRPDRFVV